MSEELKASIVRLLDAKGAVIGAGFLISKKELLTCAHVVAQAQGEVHLDFPLVAPGNTLSAEVIGWRQLQPSTSVQQDVAMLKLVGDPPKGSQPARLTWTKDLWGGY